MSNIYDKQKVLYNEIKSQSDDYNKQNTYEFFNQQEPSLANTLSQSTQSTCQSTNEYKQQKAISNLEDTSCVQYLSSDLNPSLTQRKDKKNKQSVKTKEGVKNKINQQDFSTNKNPFNQVIPTNYLIDSIEQDISQVEVLDSTYKRNKKKSVIKEVKSDQQNIQLPDLYQIKQNLRQINQNDLEYIINFLHNKKCYGFKYLTSGGEADVLKGIYTNSKGKTETCVFKLTPFEKGGQKNIQEEIDILTLLIKSTYTIQLVEHFLLKEIKVAILVIKWCQFSLFQEMEQIKKTGRNYTYDQLCYIISDLIDGVIELRMYKIIHSDIKPQNILKTFDNTYVYSDFGISRVYNEEKTKNFKGFTRNYCPPEQTLQEAKINYLSDVYSLGVIINGLINLCLDQQKLSELNKFTELQNKKLQQLLQLIGEKMVNKDCNQREKCIELLFLYYDIIGKDNISMQFYIKQKIRKFPLIYNYGDRDSKFMNSILLKYQLLNLQIYIDQYGLKINAGEIADLKNKENLKKFIIISNFNVLKYLRLISTISNLYLRVGQCENSISLRELCEQIVNKIQVQDGITISEIYFQIGQLFINQRKEEETTLQYFEKCLNILTKIFISDHPMKAKVYQSIGHYYQLQFKTDWSLQKLQLSLQMFEKLYNCNHLDIANVLDLIGMNYNKIVATNMALQYSFRSLEMKKCIYNNDSHVEICITFYNIGYSYYNCSDYINASIYFEKSKKCLEELFDENNPLIGETLYWLANGKLNLNKPREAIKLYLKAIRIYNNCYQYQNHLMTAAVLNFTSQCLSNLGEFEKAIYCQSYSIWMKIQEYKDLSHPYIATSYSYKGNIYLQLGNFCKSYNYNLFSYLLNINCQDESTIALSKQRISRYFLIQGKPKQGLKYSSESLRIFKKLNPGRENHIDFAKCLLTIGKCQLQLGQQVESLSNCLESLKQHQQLLKGNETHQLMAACLEGVGDCYLSQGNFQESLNYYQQSYNMNKILFPINHPEIAQSQFKLGFYYETIGYYKECLYFYIESLKIRKNQNFQNKFYLQQTIIRIIICFKMNQKLLNQQE